MVDKFYTKHDVAAMCFLKFEEVMSPSKEDTIVEPSAGNGSFSRLIKDKYPNHYFCDLDPESSEITRQDYLNLDMSFTGTVHVVGNPPFGKQSMLARKFIKKSSEFATTINFILPRSFKKLSLQKVFPLEYHLICQLDLPETSFTLYEKDYKVPCVFQCWRKLFILRVLPCKEVSKYFKFVNRNGDFSFRRVGGKAGTIDKDCNKSVQSHYFIKLNSGVDLNNFIERLTKIKFNSNYTVGPKSISKQELIHETNQLTF